MDFFINLGITGISLIFLGKLALRRNKTINESNNLEFIDKLMRYMESELLAKINLKYGKQLLIASIVGVLFYNTFGLFMVLVTVLVFTSYLINLFISGYKYCMISKR
ncbi:MULTISPECIES: hypothetical protein [Romboutsia]|jgi:hypothetical protein|uniref:Uncharacterized protein n=1 Tax=Romboutsia ilealis TaxID=1115758 RepID=A0A1V1HZH1_9FIRM|nr:MULTISPECIES: hypothetical protein [Romboutsia]MCI9062110.1 hypothetical protein [Romboutsia sp.]MCI9260215.1 hypothetical protein [Romboutsia sp.]CED93303.1 Hypothetical protein CRIB_548 [Romboutsia ilealis]